MILHGVEAHNFMSLRNCTINELDNHLNFLVGPNGSGKTTIFRVLRVVRDILGNKVSLEQFCTRGVNPQEIDLIIDVEFNTEWEQELITTFLCASLNRPDELPSIINSNLPQRMELINTEGRIAFSNWLLHLFRPKTLSFLFRGKLSISYRSQNYETPRISYTFEHNNLPFTCTVRPWDSVLIRGNISEYIGGGYSPTSGLIDFFKRTTGLQDIVDLLTRQSFPTANSFDPVACLLYLADKKVALGINNMNAQHAFLPAQRRFAELSGNLKLADLSNRSFTFGYTLQLIIQRALVFTNNLRMPIENITAFNWQEMTNTNLNFDDEQQIPLLLYRLKNGNFSERSHFQRIQRAFKKLVGENISFDIYAKLENTQQQQPVLTIDVRVTDQEGEIPLIYHGAGIWEALMLSTILDESDGRVILLDEPASNLHPGMQRKLINILQDIAGQIIVVTHSTHMLPTTAEDFHKVRRVQKNGNSTLVKGIESSNALRSEKVEKELNKSSDLAGLLFADGVILVEGETEIGALNEWFPKSAAGQGKTFSDLNLTLYWVGGKANFPFYMHFLSGFGIPWIIICDGDALPINKDRNDQLWKTLKSLKHIENLPDAAASFENLKVFASRGGVYTANTSYSEKFEDIPSVKAYISTNTPSGYGKVQQGRYIAAEIPCPKEIEEILQFIRQRLGK